MNFKNSTDTFTINNDCSEFIYNKNKYIVTDVFHFTEKNGAFCSNNILVKFACNMLQVYDNGESRVLLDTFVFDKFNHFKVSVSSIENVKVNEILAEFVLKKNCVIFLYKDHIVTKFNGIETKEDIIDIVNYSDNNKLYKTKENSLFVSSTSHCKWNKIPVGKV